jgi:response regulator RpfG family c-di-GMP phosphodiesterase
MSWTREQALIVDSDSGARAAAVATMAAAGYDCHESEDIAAACDFVREMERGLVLTELDLPGGSGMELIAVARRRYPDIGVLIVSGTRDAEAAAVALRDGALDYVVKPAAPDELRRRVALSLERQRLLLQHREYHSSLERKVVEQARELQHTYEQVLSSLGEAVAARHCETHSHTQRVTHLSLRLARALGLRGSALTGVEWGAALHDVGKIGIPDAILLKPASLTDEEWETMKRHCEIGHHMLRGFGFLRDALAVVLHHHEHFDGSGYPFGLAGDTIPFSARIFAVVDAYDAMTSDRPYRPPLDPEEAKDELARCSARQFDPCVVDAFLELSRTSVRGAAAYAGA